MPARRVSARHRRRGEIERLPRLFAVQPANCAPLCASFASGAEDYMPIEALPTIAEGTAIAKPVRTREVLAAIRRFGAAVSVAEEEIVEAMNDLATSGLYVEPTSASAAAALGGLLRRGVIRPDETTVVVLTGAGLKATERIGELMGVLPTSA